MVFQRKKVASALGIVLGVGGIGTISVPALAQDIRVDVTGSNIRRVEGEGALPVQVITRDEIDRTGTQTVAELLQYVSSNSSFGSVTTANSLGNIVFSQQTASLRGLGGQSTLVLLNGKRLVQTGGEFQGLYGVNLDAIPFSAIERVEILKDGASAVYGSDAIGGVINFIMRQDFRGVEVTGYYGQPTRSEGNGSIWSATATAGFGDLAKDKYNVFINAYYQKQESLDQNQRSFSDSSIDIARGLNGTSGNTFPGTVSTGGIGAPTYPNCFPSLAAGEVGLGDIYGNACRYDPAAADGVNSLPKKETTSFFGSARWQFNPNWQAYFTGSYSEVKTTFNFQPTPLSDVFPWGPNQEFDGSFLLPPNSPYYPTALAQAAGVAGEPLNIRWRAYPLGHRNTTDTSENWQTVAGVKGTAWNWDFDFDFAYSESKTKQALNGGYALYPQILPLLNSGVVNPFGPSTPDVQAQIDALQFRDTPFTGKSTGWVLEGKASGDIWKLPAGSMAAAVGFQYGTTELEQTPSAAMQSGAITGFGTSVQPISADRDVWSVYGELLIPVVKNLELTAAVRYDDYSDFGSTTNPKIAFRWNPVRQLLFRGSWGTGFVAPTLTQIAGPNVLAASQPGLSDPLRCPTTNDAQDCDTQFSNLFGGNAQLQPQESKQWLVGLVFEPIAGVSIGFDWFDITVDDLISNGVPPLTILNNLAQYGHLVTRGPVDPRFPTLPGPITSIDQRFLNLGQVKMDGFDVNIRATGPATDWGRFSFNLDGTYYRKYDVQQPDGSFLGSVSNQLDAALGGVIPRYKQYATVTWTRGPWSATLGNSYQSSYIDVNRQPWPDNLDGPACTTCSTRRVDSLSLWDWYGSYTGFKNWKFVLGVKNLFDEDPPFSNSQTNFQVGYDPTYYDPRARFIYGSVTYTFK